MAHYELSDAMQAARVKCSQERPYLTSLLLRLSPVAVKGLKTLAVDKYARLYFDPELNWSVPQYATVLYHEVCHLLRDHAGRGETMGVTPSTPENAQAWNVAADCEINDDIEAEGGAQWPFPPCMPKSLNQKNGLFAEEYFNSMPKVGRQGGTGAKGVGAGDCGGAAGNPKDFEQGPPAGAGQDDKGNAPGITPAEMEIVKHKVAADIKEHVKSRGTVPGHLQDWAQNILEPKVNWRKLLRSSIRRAVSYASGMTDYCYSKPSRRQNAMPKVVLPNMIQPIPRIKVVIDTSGSMSEEDLAKVLGEVNGVLKQCGQRDGVDAIVCDAQVHSARKVFRADQIQLAGRGGTDMRKGIAAALEGEKPHAIIVLTDGETPWPDAPVYGTVIIAAIVGLNRNVSVPHWIKTVMIDED